jgi:5'-AMP-activated protein kinase, regulatory gamma subunit
MFAGMFTVSDIIHLIQYFYHTSSYDNAAADVETFRLESLRGKWCTPLGCLLSR